jgi:hypothetical protein
MDIDNLDLTGREIAERWERLGGSLELSAIKQAYCGEVLGDPAVRIGGNWR